MTVTEGEGGATHESELEHIRKSFWDWLQNVANHIQANCPTTFFVTSFEVDAGRKKVFLATGSQPLQLKTAVILGGCASGQFGLGWLGFGPDNFDLWQWKVIRLIPFVYCLLPMH